MTEVTMDVEAFEKSIDKILREAQCADLRIVVTGMTKPVTITFTTTGEKVGDGFGMLSAYANPDLIPYEEDAFMGAIVETKDK